MGGRLQGKVALVTGGGRGIGRAICEAYAREGAAIGVLDLRLDVAEPAAEAIRAAGGKAIAIAGNVANREEVFAAAETLKEAFGPVTLLVNNAMWNRYGPLEEQDETAIGRMIDVGFKGVIWGYQAVLGQMREAGGGAIVNIASIGARLGGDMLAHYGPSKAAVIEMSHSVARIGATRGLRSNTVMPGLILTDMWLRTIKELRRRDPSLTDVSDADVFDSFVAQMVPMGRAQTPGDIAEMVAFLLSDKARNVTGQTIAVDGGAVMT